MKLTLTQPCVNVTRNLLNQTGYCKDFGDVFLAGKTLSQMPEAVMLPPTATQADVDNLRKTKVDFELDDKGIEILKKSIKHFCSRPDNQPTEYHFELFVALNLDPSKSL